MASVGVKGLGSFFALCTSLTFFLVVDINKSEIMSLLMLSDLDLDLLTSEQHILQKIRRIAIVGWPLAVWNSAPLSNVLR